MGTVLERVCERTFDACPVRLRVASVPAVAVAVRRDGQGWTLVDGEEEDDDAAVASVLEVLDALWRPRDVSLRFPRRLRGEQVAVLHAILDGTPEIALSARILVDGRLRIARVVAAPVRTCRAALLSGRVPRRARLTIDLER